MKDLWMTWIGLLLSLVLIPSCDADSDYLYFNTPGSTSLQVTAAVLGGPIDVNSHGQAENLRMTGYRCLSGEFTTFNVKSLSHDAQSGKMAFQLKEDDSKTLLSVVRFPMCKRLLRCTNDTSATMFKQVSWQNVEVTAIAYRQDTLYMLAIESRAVDVAHPGRGKEQRVLLKKFLSTCDGDLPFKLGGYFDPDRCTSTLTVVMDKIDQNQMKVAPFNSLVFSHRDQGNDYFLTVIAKERKDERDYVASLMVISTSNFTKVLHESPFPRSFIAYPLANMGGISLRHGKICWTALNKALCGDWDSAKLELTNVKIVLRGDSKEVCEDASDSRPLTELITGIAITESTDELSFYFGCDAGTKNKGGAGMGVVTPNGNTTIYKLTSNGTNVNAGAMFLTTHCTTHHHGNGIDHVGASTSKGHVISLSTALVMFMILFSF